jgi:NAD(P)-dependent dehydrogenase (short-subunit alcohol dehydrogenase family)
MSLCLADEEDQAVEACAGSGRIAYAASKRAIAIWAINASVTPEWAGANIALNVVAPGMVRTPMSEFYMSTAEMRAEAVASLPQPFKGIGAPHDVAELLVWLTGVGNRFVTGQVIFADGGYQALASGAALPVAPTPAFLEVGSR